MYSNIQCNNNNVQRNSNSNNNNVKRNNDNVQRDNNNDNNDNKLKQDLADISKNGLKAKIQTEEGKIHYMLYCLEQYIINNEISKVKFLYDHFRKSENKLSFEMSIKYSETLIKMERLVGRKDDKGFWEYSIFQKIIIPNEEQNIKAGLKPENCMDIKKIDHYLNPKVSLEEQLVINYNSGIKLSKKDMIIYNLYVTKKKDELEKDICDIERLSVKATPVTVEGKIHYMMHILNIFIKKNQLDNIANVYLKLKDPMYIMSEELKNKYSDLLNKMNEIISSLDLIKLQFTKFYNQMPPLNQKGFRSFDDWQKETINNINNDKSTIVCAPTSAGKSVISGYVVTKGKSLYIVPTDALAWQVASFIGTIMNLDIPILTLTYQTNPKREELIKLLNQSQAIVGTPELILDYLPFIKNDFKWVILDEIHMMGKLEGSAMELISKILSDSSFLCLSATIGNVDQLKHWYESITNKQIETIICDKRFFNLQKYFYNNDNKQFQMLNPLSLISIDEIKDGSIVNKSLNPTPLDTWSLSTKMLENNIELNELNPYNYFGKTELIELTKSYEYFNKLIIFMVENFDKYESNIKNILYEYSNYDFTDYNANLINLIDDLKENNMFPAIIFQQNTISCLEIVRKTAEDLEEIELLKYPNLRKDRMQQDKNIKRMNKKIEKDLSNLTEKQLDKKLKENKDFVFDLVASDNISAPHNDFIYNKDDKFTDIEIKEWADKFKMYFPCINGDYHYLIRLLWRGIGVYVNGLPDGYLRLVQKLASQKKLAIVFSDSSLVFGISMPFRSSVIYKNDTIEDNLDSMLYHQMAGRAGRRGLDKEGNVIFVGYSWARIKELSISSIPNIEGMNRLLWSFVQATNISSNQKFLDINKNMFGPILSTTYITNFENNILTNNENIWNFSAQKDKNLIQLMWMLRYSNEGIIISFLLPYLRKYFEMCNPNEINKQVEVAYFLSKFIDIHIANDEKDILQENKSKIAYEDIYNELANINISISDCIDGKIWVSIRNNCLVDIKDNVLRKRLFNFSTKLKALQHYCYHTKQVNLTKLFGKLLTRIWWIYHTSSPVIRYDKYQNIELEDFEI